MTDPRSPRVRRRVPRWSELRPYLRTGPIHLSPVDRRLASAATIWDLAVGRPSARPAARSSTTSMGRPRARPACGDLGKLSSGWSSCRACCGMCPRSTCPRRSSGARRRCPWCSHRLGSRGSCTRRGSRRSPGSPAGWASPTHSRRSARRRPRTSPLPPRTRSAGSSCTCGTTVMRPSTSSAERGRRASRR